MSSVAIITARGGSKRIPRKNIKSFLGKPIIAYSIQSALDSNVFDEVMVSTDDLEIKAIAEHYGAIVPFMRSEENANDYATTVDTLLEVINTYQAQDKYFEYGCCIYPTAPFITTSLLQRAYRKLIEEKLDSVFPVMPFSFPIQRALKINKTTRIEMFHPEYLTARSQDLEPAYHDTGQFYWFNTKQLLTKKNLWTNNTSVVQVSEMEAHDIDTMEDWKVAEFKYKMMLHEKA